MVDSNECDIGYLNEIFSHIDLNEDYNFIVGRSNTPKEIATEQTILSSNGMSLSNYRWRLFKTDQRFIRKK